MIHIELLCMEGLPHQFQLTMMLQKCFWYLVY